MTSTDMKEVLLIFLLPAMMRRMRKKKKKMMMRWKKKKWKIVTNMGTEETTPIMKKQKFPRRSILLQMNTVVQHSVRNVCLEEVL